MIKLVSSDGVSFEVEEAVALESLTLKHVIEDGCADNDIPVPEVTSKILAEIIEYCKMHVDAARKSIEAENLSGVDRFCLFLAGNPKTNEEQLQAWDQAFVKGFDVPTLIDLILIANYLNIKTLLDLTCQNVADMIKGKTPAEISKTFNQKRVHSGGRGGGSLSSLRRKRRRFVVKTSGHLNK